MTQAEYECARDKILKVYDRQRKYWAQSTGVMHLALLQEKNDRLAVLAWCYREEKR